MKTNNIYHRLPFFIDMIVRNICIYLLSLQKLYKILSFLGLLIQLININDNICIFCMSFIFIFYFFLFIKKSQIFIIVLALVYVRALRSIKFIRSFIIFILHSQINKTSVNINIPINFMEIEMENLLPLI